MRRFRKILYRVYLLVAGSRDWLTRHFTTAGLSALTGAFVVGSFSLDTEQTRAYLCFAFLCGLLAVAALGGWGFRGRFTVTRHLPRFGTAGTPLSYVVAVRNDTTRQQAGLLLREDFERSRLSFEEFAAITEADDRATRSFRIVREAPHLRFTLVTGREAEAPSLRPGEEADVRMEIVALRRGLVRFRGMGVGRRDPLGLVKSLTRLRLPQSVLMLPRRYAVPRLNLPGGPAYQSGGVSLALAVGQSEEFMALREYRRGDPLRRIHWRSWAHVGHPVVKEFEDEFFVRHALVLDTFTARPQSDLLEEAVSVAASFASALETQESLLDLLFVGPRSYCFTAGRGVATTERMLEVLASVQACRDHDFDALASLVLGHVQQVSGCICILLAWDQPRQELVRRLKGTGTDLMVLVIRPPGQVALDPGPLRDQPGRFHVLELGAIAEGLARL